MNGTRTVSIVLFVWKHFTRRYVLIGKTRIEIFDLDNLNYAIEWELGIVIPTSMIVKRVVRVAILNNMFLYT